MGYSPWGHKESDTTERLLFHFLPNHWQTTTCLLGEGSGQGLVPRLSTEHSVYFKLVFPSIFLMRHENFCHFLISLSLDQDSSSVFTPYVLPFLPPPNRASLWEFWYVLRSSVHHPDSLSLGQVPFLWLLSSVQQTLIPDVLEPEGAPAAWTSKPSPVLPEEAAQPLLRVLTLCRRNRPRAGTGPRAGRTPKATQLRPTRVQENTRGTEASYGQHEIKVLLEFYATLGSRVTFRLSCSTTLPYQGVPRWVGHYLEILQNAIQIEST